MNTYTTPVPPGGRPGPPLVDTPVDIDLGPTIPTLTRRPGNEHERRDMIEQEDIERIKGALGERFDTIEQAARQAEKAARAATVAAAGRFERRVEGWSTGETVAAAAATLAIGVAIGGFLI